VGRGNKIELTRHIRFPHSLGLLYSAFTYYCGFKVNSGEYKLMGLAPYGAPIYAEVISKQLIDVKPDGSFWLNMDYFNYCHGLTMTGQRFHALFGGPPRDPETIIEQRHMDLAASIQAVTEEIVLRMSRDIHSQTAMKYLVLAATQLRARACLWLAMSEPAFAHSRQASRMARPAGLEPAAPGLEGRCSR
jgi:carbamoyltransferase